MMQRSDGVSKSNRVVSRRRNAYTARLEQEEGQVKRKQSRNQRCDDDSDEELDRYNRQRKQRQERQQQGQFLLSSPSTKHSSQPENLAGDSYGDGNNNNYSQGSQKTIERQKCKDTNYNLHKNDVQNSNSYYDELHELSEIHANENPDESASTIMHQTVEDTTGSSEVSDSLMVFQCKRCNSIIGDSTTWVVDDCTLNSFTLKKVSACVRSNKKMTTSSLKYDIGSTYEQLICVPCSSVIGRIYKTTPTHLDSLRHLPTIMAHAVKCYRIGSGKSLSSDADQLADLPTLEKLSFEVEKTQTIVVALSNRISALETKST